MSFKDVDHSLFDHIKGFATKDSNENWIFSMLYSDYISLHHQK